MLLKKFLTLESPLEIFRALPGVIMISATKISGNEPSILFSEAC